MDMLHPGLASREILAGTRGLRIRESLVQHMQHDLGVTNDTQVGSLVLVDFRFVHINVQHARIRSEGIQTPGDAVVKTNSQANQCVALGHAHIRRVAAVHP